MYPKPPVNGPDLWSGPLIIFGHTVDTMKPVIKGIWLVQAIEYALGFVLAWSAVNASDPVVPILFAIVIIMNAAIVAGSLAAFRITNAVVHRLAGIAIAIAAFASVFLAPLQASTQISLACVAVAQGFVSVRFGHGIRTTRS